MKSKLKVKNAIVILFSLVLGFLLVRQAVVVKQSLLLTKQDNLMNLAYGIVGSSNSIFDLQEEYNDLKEKNSSFSFDMKDRTKMKEDIQNKISNYRSVNGLDPINGRGIEIKVDGTLLTEEIVDLINGIRNTKPDAIAISNKRIIYRSYFIVNSDGKMEFDNNKISFPFFIEILGDPDELTKSLTRSGGILDVLKKNSFGKINFSIERKDSLFLPAYDGRIDFRYAKNS